MGVDGWCGEHLSLVAPLPLGKRPAPQWLHGLETALSYSLGSSLAECHSSLPDSLAGAGNTEQQGIGRAFLILFVSIIIQAWPNMDGKRPSHSFMSVLVVY